MTIKHGKYVPRISFEVSPEQQQAINKYLPIHGTKKAVYSALTDGLIRLFERGKADIVLGAIFKRAIGPEDLLGIRNETKEAKE